MDADFFWFVVGTLVPLVVEVLAYYKPLPSPCPSAFLRVTPCSAVPNLQFSNLQFSNL